MRTMARVAVGDGTCLAWLLAALCQSLPAMAVIPAPSPAVHEVDWHTSPLDLNLRGLDGERFRFHCPPGRVLPGQVVGSGPYTDGSSICCAGVHAGVIRPATGGVLTIEMRPGQAAYVASLSHYVQSERYDQVWGGSFLVLSGDSAAAPH